MTDWLNRLRSSLFSRKGLARFDEATFFTEDFKPLEVKEKQMVKDAQSELP